MLEFQRVLTSIADSIRTLNETEAPLTLDEMGAIMGEVEEEAIVTEEFINFYNNNQGSIPQLNNEFVTGEISNFFNLTLEEIPPYTLAYQSNIKKVNFQNCYSIQTSAFASTEITEASFPECRFIGSSAFTRVSSLVSISAPQCYSIGSSAFQSCYNLSSIDFPKCKFIGSSAFYNCSNLSKINLPECKSVGQGAFQSCSLLTEVILPKCSSIGLVAFPGAKRITLPLMSYIPSRTFLDYRASYYSFAEARYVENSAFSSNSYLEEIYLPKCKAINASAFVSASTPALLTL